MEEFKLYSVSDDYVERANGFIKATIGKNI